MIIAIDGPAGSGKSTVAKLIAKRLSYRHIDTGAMYRAIAWTAQQKGLSLADESAVARIAKNLEIDFIPGAEGQAVIVDGKNATAFLKNEAVGRGAAIIAGQQFVREVLVARQRNIGKTGNMVMDGRDIGTVVFPKAEKKFFFVANAEERGRRRYEELKANNPALDLKTIIEEIRQRDKEDQNRKISPLIKAVDAMEVDTTLLSIEEVADHVLENINNL
jgi:CMP/dCMP kinase